MIRYGRNIRNHLTANVISEISGEKFFICYTPEVIKAAIRGADLPFFRLEVSVDKGYIRNLFSPLQLINVVEYNAKTADKSVEMFAELCDICSAGELKDVYMEVMRHQSFGGEYTSGSVFRNNFPIEFCMKIDQRTNQRLVEKMWGGVCLVMHGIGAILAKAYMTTYDKNTALRLAAAIVIEIFFGDKTTFIDLHNRGLVKEAMLLLEVFERIKRPYTDAIQVQTEIQSKMLKDAKIQGLDPISSEEAIQRRQQFSAFGIFIPGIPTPEPDTFTEMAQNFYLSADKSHKHFVQRAWKERLASRKSAVLKG